MKNMGLCTSIAIMVLWGTAGCSSPAPEPESPITPRDFVATEQPHHQHILYYFHRTVRCNECIAMELNSREVLNNAFEDEVASGALEYRVVNLDDPGNEQYASAFELSYSSLVLSDQDDAGNVLQWKNLDEAWEKSRDPDAFKIYLTDAVSAWLHD